MNLNLYLFFLFSFCIDHLKCSLNWLSIVKLKNLNLNSNYTDETTCDRLIGWSNEQKTFCQDNYYFMETIRKAAKLTLDECQYQFKSRRWNCSIGRSLPNIFNRLPESGIREASFVYALSSAALTHRITSSCSEGNLAGCSCDETKQGFTSLGHYWSGCSDNIAYGMAVSENFLDPRIKNRPGLMRINLHNYELGRKIIEKNMVKQCKCHGVSGSCEIKSCWRVLPSFSFIANKLKEKYDSATQVEIRRQINNKQRLVPKNRALKKLSKVDLIFLNKSPDFCQPITRLASYGTRDRVCNRTSRGIDNCDLLCCGRPYVTHLEKTKYKCNCTFKWCCSVNCMECESAQQVTRCK